MANPENNQFFTEWEESFESFDQMGLHENLLRGIYAYGGRRDRGVTMRWPSGAGHPGAGDPQRPASLGPRPKSNPPPGPRPLPAPPAPPHRRNRTAPPAPRL